MTRRQLKQQLKGLRAVTPSEAWLSAHRTLLLAQVQAQHGTPLESLAGWRGRLQSVVLALEAGVSAVGSVLAARTVATATLAVALLLSAGGYVVAAAEGSVPGDRLYGVKLGVENVRFKFANSPQERVGLQIEFAARRLEELRTLTAHAPADLPRAEALVGEFRSNVEGAAATVASAAAQASREGVEAARIVDSKVAEYEHVLRLTREAPEVAKEPSLARQLGEALTTVSRASTGSLKVIASKDPTAGPDVAKKLDEKIKVAEASLKASDDKLAALPAGGAKGSLGTSAKATEARDQSEVAKTNLAEAKQKVIEGDYQAAIAILEGVEDIVVGVAESTDAAAAEAAESAPVAPDGADSDDQGSSQGPSGEVRGVATDEAAAGSDAPAPPPPSPSGE